MNLIFFLLSVSLPSGQKTKFLAHLKGSLTFFYRSDVKNILLFTFLYILQTDVHLS